METHRIETRFGPVDVRVYRLVEGWWPVPIGRHALPAEPVLADASMPQTVAGALRLMADAIDRLPHSGTIAVVAQPGSRGSSHAR